MHGLGWPRARPAVLGTAVGKDSPGRRTRPSQAAAKALTPPSRPGLAPWRHPPHMRPAGARSSPRPGAGDGRRASLGYPAARMAASRASRPSLSGARAVATLRRGSMASHLPAPRTSEAAARRTPPKALRTRTLCSSWGAVRCPAASRSSRGGCRAC